MTIKGFITVAVLFACYATSCYMATYDHRTDTATHWSATK